MTKQRQILSLALLSSCLILGLTACEHENVPLPTNFHDFDTFACYNGRQLVANFSGDGQSVSVLEDRTPRVLMRQDAGAPYTPGIYTDGSLTIKTRPDLYPPRLDADYGGTPTYVNCVPIGYEDYYRERREQFRVFDPTRDLYSSSAARAQ